MSEKVQVYVGTSKGGFIFESDRARKAWKSTDILFKGWSVMHINLDPRDQRLHAATAHFVYGPTTQRRWAYADSKAMDEFLELARKEFDRIASVSWCCEGQWRALDPGPRIT